MDTVEGLTDLHEIIAAIVRAALADEALGNGLKGRIAEIEGRLERVQDCAAKRRQIAKDVMVELDLKKLAIAEPKRLRDKAHLKFVASQPCLVCGRQPCDPHHLRFAQPRAIGLKVSDEFTVPLCRGHHRQLHQAGDERAWWEGRRVNALEIARGLWEKTHPTISPAPLEQHPS